MLGGQGNALERPREFSEIEMAILEKILIVCMQLLREPWKNVIEINPVLDLIETNPQFAQIIAPSDMIAIVTLNIRIGEVDGLMNICLPYFTLESIMDNLNTKFWYSTMQENPDENYQEHLESLVKRVNVPLRAILGTSSISVNDFMNLQIGDIIRLDSEVGSDLTVYVGNIKKFTAVPGSSKEKYAVQVTSVLGEEE